MGANQVMASNSVAELSDENKSFMDFVQDNINLLLKSNKPFLICSKEGISPILLKKDKDGIWIAFLSEI